MQWKDLLKIRKQRVTQAQRSLAAARAKEATCESACAQVQQRIEKLQQALQRNGLPVTMKSMSLERVIAEQQHRYALHHQIDHELQELQKAQETLAKACRVSADNVARYLLLQRKQESVQQQLGKEQRVAAMRATEREEELATEQLRANDLLD